MSALPSAVKPLFRGWLHLGGAVVAVGGSAVLVRLTAGDVPKAATMLVYGVSMVVLLGVSAAYHLGRWGPRVRVALRSLDHANIFLFIAASYTPIAFNAFAGWWRVGILVAIWALALAGMATSWPALRLPRWAQAAMYVSTGWVAVIALPEVVARLGWTALWLFLAGGVTYSLGAAAYASRRPRLWPRVFGYHEVFHLLVLGASAVFYATIVLYVVPIHRA